MVKLPEPPSADTLRALGPEIAVLAVGTRVWRVYQQAGPHPGRWNQLRWWGPGEARFDHHLPPPRVQDRGILYGALGPEAAVTALAEVFQAARLVDRRRGAPAWVAFELAAEVPLLDLTGAWPTRAGASMALASGRRDRARRWAQACHAALPEVHGLLYSSSNHANQPCVALWERAEPALPARPVFHRSLDDVTVLPLLKGACLKIGYALW